MSTWLFTSTARRRIRILASGLLILAFGTSVISISIYYSGESRALRRINALGGHAGTSDMSAVLQKFPPGTPLGKVIARFQFRPRVTDIDLRETAATDADIASLARCLPHLYALDVSSTSITDASFAKLALLKNLTVLHAGSTALTGRGISSLGKCPTLAALDLSGTEIDDAALAELAQLPQLQRLVLDGTSISDVGLAHLIQAGNLRILIVSNTDVTWAGVENFEKANSTCRVLR